MGMQIGKFRPSGGVRKNNHSILVVALVLAVVNIVAGYLDASDTVWVIIANLLCAVAALGLVVREIWQMEPRKRWKMLSFLLLPFGVLALLGGRIIDNGDPMSVVLIVAGVVVLAINGWCMYQWRRSSLAEQQSIQQHRKRNTKKGK